MCSCIASSNVCFSFCIAQLSFSCFCKTWTPSLIMSLKNLFFDWYVFFFFSYISLSVSTTFSSLIRIRLLLVISLFCSFIFISFYFLAFKNLFYISTPPYFCLDFTILACSPFEHARNIFIKQSYNCRSDIVCPFGKSFSKTTLPLSHSPHCSMRELFYKQILKLSL